MRVWITGAFAALIATLAGCYGNTTTMPDGTTSTADGWITEPPEGDWVNVSCDVVHPRQRNDCFRYHAGAKISAFETIQQARAREVSAASGGSLGTYQHPSAGADDVLRWTNADCKNLQEPDRAACWRYQLTDETNNEMAAFEAREQHIQQVGCPMATNGYRPMLDLAGQDASHVECDLAACQRYAASVSVGGNAVGGAVLGALFGAAFGVVVGDTSWAARTGAKMGAFSGAVQGGASAAGGRTQIVRNCMAGRGYRVLM